MELKNYISKHMDSLVACGARMTGSGGHNNFIGQIKDEIRSMGIEPNIDSYYLSSWFEKSKSLVLHDKSDEEIHLSSAWPYSGETPEEGITAELVRVKNQLLTFAVAKDKIALLEISDFEKLPSKLAFNTRSCYPADVKMPKYYKGPVAMSFVKALPISLIIKEGVKAIICIWNGLSDGMIEGQYLPFILDYMGIPCVFVGEKEGKKLKDAAKRKKSVTLKLLADKDPQTKTETVAAIIEGTDRNGEAIIVNTHTDGPNCVEENGAVAMLAMMRHFMENKPKRTLIFLFVTGHFRLPVFESKGTPQASMRWLKNHRELWDGEGQHLKAVGGVTVEHLGCTEWKDVDGVYQKTNDIDLETVYTGNKKMDEIYFKALEGRTRVRTVTLRGHNFLHFGEGQALFNAGIPEIALCTMPDYLCTMNENQEIDKFDLDLMVEQTETMIKCVSIMDGCSHKELGKPDGYSLLWMSSNSGMDKA